MTASSRSRSLPDKRYVAFVDILGYRSLLERMFDGEPELFQRALKTLRELKNREYFSLGESQVTAFSDSIVISVSLEEGLTVLSADLMFLAVSLLKQGVLCRGGVAVGRTFHDNGILLGEGLLKAYDLERSVAQFPRIVLEPQLATHLELDLMPLPIWKRDADGYLFLNLFSDFIASPRDKFDIVAHIEAATRAQLDAPALRRLRATLVRLLQTEEQRSGSQRVLDKIKWMVAQFNETVTGFLPNRVRPIPIP
jgi:hypothetical protein